MCLPRCPHRSWSTVVASRRARRPPGCRPDSATPPYGPRGRARGTSRDDPQSRPARRRWGREPRRGPAPEPAADRSPAPPRTPTLQGQMQRPRADRRTFRSPPHSTARRDASSWCSPRTDLPPVAICVFPVEANQADCNRFHEGPRCNKLRRRFIREIRLGYLPRNGTHMRQRLLAIVLAGCLAATAAAQVSDQSLLNPDPQDWLMYSATYNSHRHSPLRQLTPANVPRLQAKRVYRMAGHDAIQAVPIVHNGVMYISQFNRIDALDARSGNIVWQYQRPPLTRTPQRGTAIFNNKLYVTAADGAIVAIDSRTGHTVWETKVAGP